MHELQQPRASTQQRHLTGWSARMSMALSLCQLSVPTFCQAQGLQLTAEGSQWCVLQAAKQTSGFQELLKQAEEASPEAVGQVAQQLQDLILATPIKEAFLQAAGMMIQLRDISGQIPKPTLSPQTE